MQQHCTARVIVPRLALLVLLHKHACVCLQSTRDRGVGTLNLTLNLILNSPSSTPALNLSLFLSLTLTLTLKPYCSTILLELAYVSLSTQTM